MIQNRGYGDYSLNRGSYKHTQNISFFFYSTYDYSEVINEHRPKMSVQDIGQIQIQISND